MKKTCRYLSACTLILSTGLFLVGCDSSDDDNTPLDDPGLSINPPSVPSGLRGVVYSSTAIELEWNAATDDGTVVEYQVYRDGSLVATQSTLRFYENTLTASTTQTYRVLAVDDEGNVSDAAVIDPLMQVFAYRGLKPVTNCSRLPFNLKPVTIPWSDDSRLKCFQAPTFDARFAACE